MKQYFIILLLPLLFSCTHSKTTDPLLNKRVLILGNSITQDGRYVDFIEYYLRKNYPNSKVDIISIGLSSETINGASEPDRSFLRPCIHSRLDSALALTQPDLIMACYGMNDGIFSNADNDRFDAYKKGIYKLKEKVEATGAKLILLTPTLFDPEPIKNRVSMDGEPHAYSTPFYKYNEVLDTFATWLLTLNDVQVIDLHSYLRPFLASAKEIKADSTFIPDGVHPNEIGHFLMAKKILLDLYPNMEVLEPHTSIEALKADTLFLLVRERRNVRSSGWLKYVGYTKEEVVKTNNITETLEKVKALDDQITLIQQTKRL